MDAKPAHGVHLCFCFVGVADVFGEYLGPCASDQKNGLPKNVGYHVLDHMEKNPVTIGPRVSAGEGQVFFFFSFIFLSRFNCM